MTHLGSLTDEELIARVRVSQISTPLERELSRRLADAIDCLEQERDLEQEIEEMTATNAALSDRISELEDQVNIKTKEEENA